MRSTWYQPGAMVLVCAACLAATGCMEPQTAPARQQRSFGGSGRTQVLNISDLTVAFAAAQGALADDFQIAMADPKTGVIALQPAEYTRIGGARMRRVGQLAVYKVGSSVVASIQVEIQRYVTPNLRAMSSQFRADDRPGITPIQEDGGLTPAQMDYWNPEGRDSRMEAQILQRISDAVNQTSASASQPATPTSEQ